MHFDKIKFPNKVYMFSPELQEIARALDNIPHLDLDLSVIVNSWWYDKTKLEEDMDPHLFNILKHYLIELDT